MATSSKLIRKLRRELVGNPKKAAALGLLLAVAVWFWMPLVEKYWGTGEGANGTEINAVATNSATMAATPAEGAETNKLVNTQWKQLVEWIRNDPMMQPQVPLAGTRDPFAQSEARRLAKAKAEKTVQPPPPPDLTPEQSGLVLQSTVVGPRIRTAMINSRAYHEGQTVKAPKEIDHFKLVRIGSNFVVLESNGKQYQLKLPGVEVAGLDE